MKLSELQSQVVPLKVQTPNFQDANEVLDIVTKAIELWLYYISWWCDKCVDWKFKTKSDYYPWYTTCDCECMVQNNYINRSLKHLQGIDKREILKYDYRLFTWKVPTKEYLYELLNRPKKWFYIYWPPWTWKTYSAYILLYMYSLHNTVFANSLQAVLEDARPPNKWDLYKKCEKVDVLLLDDFGREKMSEWVENKLFDLLNYRDKKNLITIFTSNLWFNELNIFSNLAIKSRFEWNCNQVKLWGKDLRNNN